MLPASSAAKARILEWRGGREAARFQIHAGARSDWALLRGSTTDLQGTECTESCTEARSRDRAQAWLLALCASMYVELWKHARVAVVTPRARVKSSHNFVQEGLLRLLSEHPFSITLQDLKVESLYEGGPIFLKRTKNPGAHQYLAIDTRMCVYQEGRRTEPPANDNTQRFFMRLRQARNPNIAQSPKFC